jgi:hypothetical protein
MLWYESENKGERYRFFRTIRLFYKFATIRLLLKFAPDLKSTPFVGCFLYVRPTWA